MHNFTNSKGLEIQSDILLIRAGSIKEQKPSKLDDVRSIHHLAFGTMNDHLRNNGMRRVHKHTEFYLEAGYLVIQRVLGTR